jgi:hydroxymethylpyrimidine/phosphomethylpyrimidine kinase
MGRGKAHPVVLAVGGLDPTGGAGILMDAAAIRAAGAFPAAVPTCIALQTTTAFGGIVPLSREALGRGLECAARSFGIGAVKVGMVGTRAAAEALLEFLEEHDDLPLILDPVLRSSAAHAPTIGGVAAPPASGPAGLPKGRPLPPSSVGGPSDPDPAKRSPEAESSSGALLLRPSALPAYRRLLRRAFVLTPNLGEIGKILGRGVISPGDARLAARELSLATGAWVLLKGGHFPWKGTRGTDVLAHGEEVTLLRPSGGSFRRDPHGTGCALASALAARIAAGDPVPKAARRAKALLSRMNAAGFASEGGRWILRP